MQRDDMKDYHDDVRPLVFLCRGEFRLDKISDTSLRDNGLHTSTRKSFYTILQEPKSLHNLYRIEIVLAFSEHSFLMGYISGNGYQDLLPVRVL